MAVPPVDPPPAVSRIAGLRLTRIIVLQRNFEPVQVIGIAYVFGRMPPDRGGEITPHMPKFLLVTEPASTRPTGPGRVDRVLGHLPNGKPTWCSWNFYAHDLLVQGA